MTCITLHNFTLNVDLRPALNKAPLEPSPISGPTWTTSKAKLDDFRAAAASLAEIATEGDPGTSREQFVATGGTCKACHDEYKSKDYLY